MMFALALLLPVAAFWQDDANHVALMDEIEARVALPGQAQPLADYGRHYAFHGEHYVVAIYLLPPPPFEVDAGCSVSDRHGSHDCTQSEIAEMRRSYDAGVALEMPKGGRRWHDEAYDIPLIADGGCMQVRIEYDIAAKRVLYAVCNGDR